MERNFDKYDSGVVQLLGTPYDLSKTNFKTDASSHWSNYKFKHHLKESIMHYGWNAFAKDRSKPTIISKVGKNNIEPSDDLTLVLLFLTHKT